MKNFAQSDEVWELFCQDIITDEERQDIAERITESFWHKDGSSYGVTLLQMDIIDSVNMRAEGIIEHNGNEYSFIAMSGNWEGFVLEDWNTAKEFEHLPVTVWKLVPSRDLINQAVMAGNGPFLLEKWDILIARPEIGEIPGKYTYDRRVQPGSYVEEYWKKKAAEHHFEIVCEDEEKQIRDLLKTATTAIKVA